jgi:hypothetical protein
MFVNIKKKKKEIFFFLPVFHVQKEILEKCLKKRNQQTVSDVR